MAEIQKIKLGGYVAEEVAKINDNFEALNEATPTKTSQLNNDSGYQNATQVATAIQSAISATGHAHFEKVAAVPTVAEASENVLYLVMNAETGHYDIYAKVEGEVVLIDDTTVNLTGYATTADLQAAIAEFMAAIPTKTSELDNDSGFVKNTDAAFTNKVDKEAGKGLSTEDFTTDAKNKLGSLRLPEAKAFTASSFTASGEQFTCTVAIGNTLPGVVMRKNGIEYGAVIVDVKVSETNAIITADEAFDGYIVCI